MISKNVNQTDVSIMIPTMNRPDLLLRLVRYYANLEFKGKLLIGDSSDKEVFDAVNDKLLAYKDNLDFEYKHLPSRSPSEVIIDLLPIIETSYACFLADDDYLIPDAISKCIEFLNNNDDYAAAHGIGVVVGSESGLANEIDSASYYRQPVRTESTAAERIKNHLEDYTVSVFSIHRTDVFSKMYMATPDLDDCPLCSDKSITTELLQCCMTAVHGKIKQIDDLYLIRQVHDNRYLLPKWFEWMTTDVWQPSYVYFRDFLTHEISAIDSIEVSEAKKIFEKSFPIYLLSGIRSGSARVSNLRRYIYKHRNLRLFLRSIKQIWMKFIPSKSINLPKLLKQSSPYYSDFIPVYTSITQDSLKLIDNSKSKS